MSFKILNNNTKLPEDKTVLIYFFHPDSVLCNESVKDIKRLEKKFQHIVIYAVDVNKGKDLVRIYGITSVPTVLLNRNELILGRHTGKVPYDKILNFIEESSNITDKLPMK